jgi:hypothetical protein
MFKGKAFQQNGALIAGVFPTSSFVALYQSAGSVSFWLINVQFEFYYEPPGFNYYTITQSISCHFIFMAFIMPWYVELPNFIQEAFYLISWVLFVFVQIVIYLSSPCAFSTFVFSPF